MNTHFKNSFAIFEIIILIAGIFFLSSCTNDPPAVRTAIASSITKTSAVSGGNVTDDGNSEVTARGVCWDITGNPNINSFKTTDGKGTGSFESEITGILENTTYYVRAYATNKEGTSYGNQVEFTTLPLADIDGNNYKTVKLGTQVWMAENLKTTRYNDGTSIPNVTDDAEWSVQTEGAYCWQNNNLQNKDIYGALYNWFTVATNKLCPTGWHVPTDSEWRTFYVFTGMSESAANGFGWIGMDNGGKLKETGTEHWATPNAGATDELGFKALPGGVRYDYSQFSDSGDFGAWWASTESESLSAYVCILVGINADINRMMYLKLAGLSVRCIKD
jgi:uncharacterized protein (TIGR02145 family)